MSDLLYIPFDNIYAAEDFRTGTLRYMSNDNAELNDACIVMRSRKDQIHIQYSQVLTSRGLVGVEFWETLVSAMFSHPPIDRFHGIGQQLRLQLYQHESFLTAIAKHMEAERSAILILLRNKNSHALIQCLMAIRPSMLCIPFSDEDDLAVQNAISKQFAFNRFKA